MKTKVKFRLQLSATAERSLTSTAAVVIIIGILALVNVLGARYFLRADLTRGKVYSLSEASRDMVRNLPDKVIAKAYFSSELPAQYADNRSYLQDTLAEYQSYGAGKFEYEIIDPKGDADIEQEAASYGIQPVTLNVLESDAASSRKVYMGLVLLYLDKEPELFPVIDSTDKLEYDITSGIYRLTAESQKVIGFLSLDGLTLDISQEFSTLYAAAGKINAVKLVTADELTGLDVLVIAGLTAKLDDATLYKIDQAFMRGTKLLALTDTFDLQAGLQGIKVDSGLPAMLEKYGIKVNADVVMDEEAETIPFPQQVGNYQYYQNMRYPYALYVTQLGESLITSELDALSLPFVSSLTIDPTAMPAGRSAEILAQSSAKSWKETGKYDFSPTGAWVQGSNKGPFVLAADVQGSFESYFKDKAIPVASVVTDGESDTSLSTADMPELIANVEDNRLVVFGGSKFVREGLALSNNNYTVVMNALDWLAQNDALIAIRSKSFEQPRIGEVESWKRNTIKWGLILGFPFGVGVVAFVYLRFRRNRMNRNYRGV